MYFWLVVVDRHPVVVRANDSDSAKAYCDSYYGKVHKNAIIRRFDLLPMLNHPDGEEWSIGKVI